MNITIADADGRIMNATVGSLSDIPQCVFALSQYKGGGTLEARAKDDPEFGNQRLFRMTAEWLED
jgi:hypothetical protein